VNGEATAPPVYYAVAAAWYKLGATLGYSGIFLLYWTRALNALCAGLLVWLGFVFCRTCYPESRFLPAGMALMLAFFPQDIFFALNPNAIFPVLFAAALLALALIYRRPERSLWQYALAGIAVAATLLAGFGNFSIIFPFLFVAGWLFFWRLFSRGGAVLLLSAGIPVLWWIVRNQLELADWSGTRLKLQYLGWSANSFTGTAHHPIFSAHGFYYFVTSIARNFWRGELRWHGDIRASWLDPVLFWTSVIFFIAFLWRMWPSGERDRMAKFADVIALLTVVVSAMFLLWLSVHYDFAGTYYPSRALPYFVSSRVVIGVVVPFLVIYLRGMESLWRKFLPRSALFAVIALVIAIFASEIVGARPIFLSPYNFYGAVAHKGCALIHGPS
jgi:hypothetical protein